MSLLLDSFWRAVAYCLHPRVVLLSILPLLLMVALAWGLAYFYWDAAIDGLRLALQSSGWLGQILAWLEGMGASQLTSVLAPLILIFAVTPLIVLLTLLVVACAMTPALVQLVAARRFAALERKRGGSLVASLLWSLASVLLALLALMLTMPFWLLLPPLMLLLPPLIWGWLTYRVMAFDVLADHASQAEREAIFRQHRSQLLVMGVITGYLGAAPTLVWASGALFAAAFVFLVPLAIWIYTLVFAFSSLWFAHYSLAALARLRDQEANRFNSEVPAGALPMSALGTEDVGIKAIDTAP